MIIGKTDFIADLGNGKIGICQQCLGQVHFPGKDITFQGNPGRFFEKSSNIFFVITKISGNLADPYVFPDSPGNVVYDVSVELHLLPFHSGFAAGKVELAVQLAQDGCESVIVLIDVAVFAVTVLQLLKQYDHSSSRGILPCSGKTMWVLSAGRGRETDSGAGRPTLFSKL